MKLIVGLFATALIAVMFCLNPRAFCDAPPNCTGEKPQAIQSSCVSPGWSGCNNFYTSDPCPNRITDDPNCNWQDITVGQGYWGCAAGDPRSDICLPNVLPSLCFQNKHCYKDQVTGACVPALAYPCTTVTAYAKRKPPCNAPLPPAS